jgi:4-hydroxybenzoate polyprenyltransferase
MSKPLCVDLDFSIFGINLVDEVNSLRIKNLYCISVTDAAKKIIPTAPINQSVKNYILKQKQLGVKVYGITSLPQSTVEYFLSRFSYLDGIFGSDGKKILKSNNRSRMLAEKFGQQGFDYLGPIYSHRSIWKMADKKIVTSTGSRFISSLSQKKFDLILEKNPTSVATIIKQLRPHQWPKNFLLFIPGITAHHFSMDFLASGFLGFFALSLVASGGYIVNDMFDLWADRSHSKKKHRPLASGSISIKFALWIAGFVIILGLMLASLLSSAFALVAFLYLIFSISYSLFLKNILLLDVFFLALLYTLRIYAGGIVAGVPVSSWLYTYSAFFFLSLAFMKRFIELKSFVGNGNEVLPGRRYSKIDESTVQQLGISSGFASIVVFSLYIYQESTRSLYHSPEFLWVVSFLILIWINRIWILAQRGVVDHDPISFAIKDKISWFIACLTISTLVVATYI